MIPTIIEPRKRKPLTQKTRDRICLSNDANSFEFFDNKDPISRVFFGKHDTTLFNDYLRQADNLGDMKVEDCVKPIELLKLPKPTDRTKPFKIDELKELLAHSSPFSKGAKNQKKRTSIFNC